MSEFREFWEIEYTTGDIYRGELRGDQRHGTGMFKYFKSGETVLGTWSDNHLIVGSKKHPLEEEVGALVALSVTKYEARKK